MGAWGRGLGVGCSTAGAGVGGVTAVGWGRLECSGFGSTSGRRVGAALGIAVGLSSGAAARTDAGIAATGAVGGPISARRALVAPIALVTCRRTVLPAGDARAAAKHRTQPATAYDRPPYCRRTATLPGRDIWRPAM